MTSGLPDLGWVACMETLRHLAGLETFGWLEGLEAFGQAAGVAAFRWVAGAASFRQVAGVDFFRFTIISLKNGQTWCRGKKTQVTYLRWRDSCPTHVLQVEGPPPLQWK